MLELEVVQNQREQHDVAQVPSGTSAFPFQYFPELPRHSCVPREAQKRCLAADPNDYNELDAFLAPDRYSIIV